MAVSACPKCDNKTFEAKAAEPARSEFKLIFIQCGKCGAVVGVLDYMNIGTLVAQAQKSIEDLTKKVSGLDHLVRQMAARR